ncbi:mCG147848 [Mus musculus]|nr:mCG147848 [Mus musculus]
MGEKSAKVQQRLGGGAKTTESLLFLLELSPCFHRTTAGLCLEEHCYPASSLASLAQVGLSSFSSKMLANGAEATGPQAEPAPKHQQCPWPPGRREPGGEVSFLKIFGGREFSGCSHW